MSLSILSHFGSSLNKKATRSGGYCIIGHLIGTVSTQDLVPDIALFCAERGRLSLNQRTNNQPVVADFFLTDVKTPVSR